MRSIPSDKIKGVQIDRPAPVKVKPIEPVKAPKEVPKDDGKVLSRLVDIVGANENNMKSLLDINLMLADILSESEKPKRWSCSVGRSGDGKISTIDIVEK